MIMRLPDSGSWLGALLSGLSQTPGGSPDNTTIDNVSEAQLNDALAALARGEIEFVILEQDDAFLQAAGDDDGPYQVEYRPSANEAMVEIAGGVDRQTAQQLLSAYARGDSNWQSSHRWTTIDE
jgi:hypothetical protein